MRAFGHCSCNTTTGRCKFHTQLLHNSPKLSRQPDRNVSSAAPSDQGFRKEMMSWIQPPHHLHTQNITSVPAVARKTRHFLPWPSQMLLQAFGGFPGFWGSGFRTSLHLEDKDVLCGCLATLLVQVTPLEDERHGTWKMMEAGRWCSFTIFVIFRFQPLIYLVCIVCLWLTMFSIRLNPHLASRTAGWSWLQATWIFPWSANSQ